MPTITFILHRITWPVLRANVSSQQIPVSEQVGEAISCQAMKLFCTFWMVLFRMPSGEILNACTSDVSFRLFYTR